MNRQAYPQYKPSGVAWLGDIPEHWEMSRVKHIARFTTGWTPQTSQDEYYFGGNPWATIADLGPRLLGDPKGRISDDAIASSRMRISPKGSLLFSFKLSIGQVSIADRDLLISALYSLHSRCFVICIGHEDKRCSNTSTRGPARHSP